MLQVHTCVSVHCAQCGDGSGAHYPTEDAALDAALVAGWLPGPGGRWWCPVCGPVLTCEIEGHDFTRWHRTGLGQTAAVPGVGAAGVRGYRWCRRCCLHESRPPDVAVADVADVAVAGEVA